MSFDISKTETFIPFLWIFGKFVFFMILVSLFSTSVFDWSLLPDPVSDGGGYIYDRLILISMLQFVLFEKKINTLITGKNDTVFRNNTIPYLTSNINLFNNLFVGFVLLSYSRSKLVLHSKYGVFDEYVFYTTQWLWISTTYVIFSYEIFQVVQNNSSTSSLVGQNLRINENMIQVLVITMLTLSLTSPLLCSVCNTISFPDFCVRVFLYTCYVCARFYLYGISSQNLFMSPLQSSSLFGWLILAPLIVVYIGFVVPFAVYIVILSRTLQRQAILPTQAHKTSLCLQPTI